MVVLLKWVLAALFPSVDGLIGLDSANLSAPLQRLSKEATLTFRLGLYLSAFAFIFSPIVTLGWPLPALWLGRSALDRHARAMAGHRWYLMRQAMLMLKTVGGAIWGADPAVRGQLGYAPYGHDPGTFRSDHRVDVVSQPQVNP
ncbi:MAG: hypothetical protein KC502_00605 [Myxococcales bacterium]|nr:hypothetical protein [Myxococcales bacterium]